MVLAPARAFYLAGDVVQRFADALTPFFHIDDHFRLAQCLTVSAGRIDRNRCGAVQHAVAVADAACLGTGPLNRNHNVIEQRYHPLHRTDKPLRFTRTPVHGLRPIDGCQF